MCQAAKQDKQEGKLAQEEPVRGFWACVWQAQKASEDKKGVQEPLGQESAMG